jgi:CheY-like chemotaxis protein
MKNTKILIVDDNEKDLKLLSAYLLSQGYEVIISKDGADVFKQLQAQNPDLVIMDIMMPDISGWKVCDKIKKDPLYQHVPILMCSAYIEDDGEFSKYAAGDCYIQKPINFDLLSATIQRLLSKKLTSS